MKIYSELCCDQIIKFEDDRITLDIPIEGISLQEQWKIIPLTRPVVIFTILLCLVVAYVN